MLPFIYGRVSPCISAGREQGGITRVLLDVDDGVHVGGARTTSGITPLHFAARHLHPGVTHMLLEAGADENATDRCGVKPCHMINSECKSLLTGVYALSRVMEPQLKSTVAGWDARSLIRSMLGRTPAYRALCGDGLSRLLQMFRKKIIPNILLQFHLHRS